VTPEPALEARRLNRYFGALHVARDVNLALMPGARHALIGPNGAGKTTLVNMLAGALPPDDGEVLIAGRDITRLGQAARVKLGLVRTFQINQLFLGLAVIDNVMLAISERRGLGARPWPSRATRRQLAEEALAYLDRLGLGPHALIPVRELPYGRQRLVEIAIALSLEPRVLLLDEPAAGVPSAESHLILDQIAALPDDIAVLIIEHDMEVVFRFARFITVLVAGAVLREGTPEAIAADPEVRAVYLGEAARG
jgi:ABC-type branched-subunit amino acid transport system ATPase component